MRIAFVRSVDVRQAYPGLRDSLAELAAGGHESALFVIDDERTGEQPVAGVTQLRASSSADSIAVALLAWEPDRVVSISVPDDKALRDSCIRDLLLQRGGPDMVMHPVASAHSLCSKWETRQVVQNHGLDVAPGFLISGDLLHQRGVAYESYWEYLGLRLRSLTFPVICKPVWDSMAQGIRKFQRPEDVEKWLKEQTPTADTVVEEYLDGELFGIEIVGSDGDYWCQPLVRKCMGHSEDLVPFNHIRFGPVTDSRYEPERLRIRMRAIASALDLRGSAEFEVMWWHGRFHVIEVNPRVSGMTNLSIAISGVNSYTALALGTATAPSPAQLFVAEVPLIRMDETRRREIAEIDGVLSLEAVTYHVGSSQWKMLFTAADASSALAALAAVAHNHGVIAIASLDEFAYTLASDRHPVSTIVGEPADRNPIPDPV